MIIDGIKNKILDNISEIICFIIFVVCTIFISFYHEPWLDEFQSWAISKDTVYNIFFQIPQYEGHPPLWHLILKCFSTFNINPELGLIIPNLFFIYCAVALLIFKSPFNKPIRLLLPFTYFLFYQYAIISRPYSLYCLALFICAIFYKSRDIHPFRYISSLILLTLTTAYGMVLAVGLVIVWFIEILKEKNFSIKTLLNDKRIFAMFIIFFECLALCFIIYPNKDVIHMDQFSDILSLKLLYVFFILPCDTLITNICYSVPKLDSINILHCLLGLSLYYVFYVTFRFYKSLLLFFIPYAMLLYVSAFLYVSTHHTGIYTIFYIFVFWCIFSNKQKALPVKINKLSKLSLLIVIGIQIYWSISAYITDYNYDYWFTKDIANYIKTNNLDKYKIMTDFKRKENYVNKQTGELLGTNITISKESEEQFYQNYYLKREINYNIQHLPVGFIPYIGKNIFYTFNMDKPDREYVVWRAPSEQENEEMKNKIISYGLPEIITSNPQELSWIFDEEHLKNVYYIKLYEFRGYNIWKDKKIDLYLPIYAREDIYNKLQQK